MKTVTHNCKLHDEPYARCVKCQHEYCNRYWVSCPHCIEQRHGFGSEQVRKAIRCSNENDQQK